MTAIAPAERRDERPSPGELDTKVAQQLGWRLDIDGPTWLMRLTALRIVDLNLNRKRNVMFG